MVETFFLITGGIVVCWYFIVTTFLLHGFLKLKKYNSSNGNKFSVVIAARDEEKNIRACLESIFTQSIDSSRYEIIVVNDRSIDATRDILSELKDNHPELQYITIDKVPKGISPKKHAVAQGIAVAKNDIIVMTDADCRVQPQWLEILDRYCTEDVGLVQGITTYFFVNGMNRIFFSLQALDFISHGIVAAAAIGAKLPINSNANNFAIRKSAFHENGGVMSGIGHIVSGDDDLLLQKLWKQKKWKIIFMPEIASAVQTMPSLSIPAVFQQRARWGSKTVHYHILQILLLSGVFLFYLFIAGCVIYSFCNFNITRYLVVLLMCKFLGECMLMIPGLLLFNKKELLPLLPLASIVQFPIVISAVVVGVFGKFSWKGQSFSRTIK